MITEFNEFLSANDITGRLVGFREEHNKKYYLSAFLFDYYGWRNKTIVVPTSGNMGLYMALEATKHNCKVIAVGHFTPEAKEQIKNSGSEAIEARGLMPAARAYSRKLAESNPQYVLFDQFSDEAHVLFYKQKASQIASELNAAGITPNVYADAPMSGGTLAGIAVGFKTLYPNCKIVSLEPKFASEKELLEGVNYTSFVIDNAELVRIKQTGEISDVKIVAHSRNTLLSAALYMKSNPGKTVLVYLGD